MIVIAGIPSEPPVALAIDSATRLGLDHVVVNQRDAGLLGIALDVDGTSVTGRLDLPDRTVDLDDVTGIYWRLMEPERLPEAGPHVPAEARERVLTFHQVFTDWVEAADCRVANPLQPMCSNGSKPFQALAVEAAGFAVPSTVITTHPGVVLAARDRWAGAIYKSTSSIRSIVRPLDDHATTDDLAAVARLATQFQATVPGTDVRVHVVGDDVHATRIESAAVDYRYGARDGAGAELTAYRLPGEIEQRCRHLAHELELPLAGIDLRVTPTGEWFCFEVNPSPGYSYYQQSTGQPISDSLVRWLAG